MKTEFMVALTQLSAEKHLPKEVVLSAIESALVSAYRKEAFTVNHDISAKINPNTGDVKVFLRRIVVEDVADSIREISLSEAQKLDRNAQLGEVISVESTPPNAGRIAAQTARQVILQRLHEAEHHVVFEEFTNKEDEIVTGAVQRVTPELIYIDLGKTEAILPANEQVHNERYRSGQRLKLYILEVARTTRGPQIIVSRAHKNLLRRLFELEVPEIYGGTVQLKSVAREAGHRSKVAVAAKQEGVDPVGCCVGLRGIRIQNIVNELNGEKIDVVAWSDDPCVFISNALSPSQVSGVLLNESEKTALVTVPDKQLSLAIGKEGQNARLAAKLTGWRIDIRSTSAATEADKIKSTTEEPAADIDLAVSEEKELAPELVAVEEAPLVPETMEDQEADKEAEELQEVAALKTSDTLELVLSAEDTDKSQTSGPVQIRFAEDILPGRATKAKAKKSSKDSEVKAAKGKTKKAKTRRKEYLDEDELEGQN
jgi:N utilization substance protein A